MKKIKILLCAFCLAMCMTSCYTSRTYVGEIKPGEPTVKVNDENVHHLLCGLIPVGNNKLDDKDYVGERKNYVVKNQQSFLDGFLSVITFGIYTPSTVTFEVPLSDIDGQQ